MVVFQQCPTLFSVFLCCQVISVLTHTTLTRIFKQHRNYDLRRPLSGAEKFFDNLLNLMDVEPGLLLTSVRCLPLDSAVREIISQTIVQHAKVKVGNLMNLLLSFAG